MVAGSDNTKIVLFEKCGRKSSKNLSIYFSNHLQVPPGGLDPAATNEYPRSLKIGEFDRMRINGNGTGNVTLRRIFIRTLVTDR